MKTDNIETIVEGAMPDTPSRLMYAALEIQIPENAILLSTGGFQKYLLYARTSDFKKLKRINCPDFSSSQRVRAYDEIKRFSEKIGSGFPLKRLFPNIKWVFDSQRSFTTRDGRIYVEVTYFHPDWIGYLRAVP